MKNLSRVKHNYGIALKALLKIGTTGYDLEKPLKVEVLEDINHKVTQTLLYIHTMETFIYKELKLASLKKDCTKILSLGPYASVLSFIIENGNKSRIARNPKLKQDY